MKTKYIKVSVSDRLPKYNMHVILIDALGNACNGYYSENNNWIVSTEGYFSIIEYWLEEVPDYEDEMREMLEFIYGYGEKVEWSKVRPQLEELLTKLKHQ